MSSCKALEDNPIKETERQLPVRARIPSRRATPSPGPLDNESSPDVPAPPKDDSPSLIHRWHHEHSILSTKAFPTLGLLFCGTHDHHILVLDMVTFERRHTLTGHTGSVLCLAKSADDKFLFSGGSDSLVKVWDVAEMVETHTIYSLVDIGDIFSIAWCDVNDTIYFGCQNTAILFVKLDYMTHKGNPEFLPSKRFDKFFDSRGPAGDVSSISKRRESVPTHGRLIEVPSSNILPFAHNGFVYSMTIHEKTRLITGGGDGIINIWDLQNGGLRLITHLDNDDSVMSIALCGNFLYCGLTEGKLKLWDLKTSQQIMMLQSDDDEHCDTLAIAATSYCVFKGSHKGITKWKLGEDTRTFWTAHDGLVLSSEIFEHNNKTYLATGGNDASVAVWNITDTNTQTTMQRKHSAIDVANESMLADLSELVSFKTVSKKPEHYIDDSRRCAHYMTSLFKKFGADSELLAVRDGNPVVYACFKGYNPDGGDSKIPRILWYGHYDVIEANNSEGWSNDPFKMTGNDGYIYGRGVSDNKGPVLAAMYAVSELLQKGDLRSDIVFLIEGEEECGSYGFQTAIKEHSNLIGDIDWILLSNSYWLDEKTPCLNYGLRGVISATVEISSDSPDRHSGVDGGVSREPTMDLVKLLSKLTSDDGRVTIPNFYDTMKPLPSEEEKLYDTICSKADIPIGKDTLLAKWRSPSLTVHKIEVSGPGNSTVIPKSSKGYVSIRIVPEQSLERIKKAFIDYLTGSFAQLCSDNHLNVKVIHEAEPWLGERGNAAYQILEKEIKNEWNVEPFYIREGGSIPSVRFLEKMFNARAAQIPCGQSTDNAHLDNERLRVSNLYALRGILKRSFLQLPKRQD